MQIAFKEWAVVVDALGRADQILILRKGGIAEGRSGFAPEHPEFLLFPTRFHQQRESVIPSAQSRFDQIAAQWPPENRVRLEFWARVLETRRLDHFPSVHCLRGQHIWRDDVIKERFEWGRSREIHALAVRVFRLPRPMEIAMLPEHAGCKSWISIADGIPAHGSEPVLNDADFEEKLARFRGAISVTVGA